MIKQEMARVNTGILGISELKRTGLENFEHYFTSVRDECNCAVV